MTEIYIKLHKTGIEIAKRDCTPPIVIAQKKDGSLHFGSDYR